MTICLAVMKAPLCVNRNTSKNGEKHLDYRKESANANNINRRKRTTENPQHVTSAIRVQMINRVDLRLALKRRQ